MPQQYLFAGVASGNEVIRYGVAFAQEGDAYTFDVQTWDEEPAGAVGVCIFRTVHAWIRHTAGYSVDVTPIVDGMSLPAQRFSGGAPPAGQTEQMVELPVYVGRRGTQIAVRVQSVTLSGPLEIVDIRHATTVIRESA